MDQDRPGALKSCLSCGRLSLELAQCARCGAPLAPHEGAPRLFDGRYAVEKELGRGGFGRVLLARDVALRRRVALKVMVDSRPDEHAVDNFYREASALASVRSEHVAQVHAFGLHEHGCFFSMEFIAGSSLAAVIDDHRGAKAMVPQLRALSVLKQVATGLSAVHAAGVIHRDVKPANVVIERDTGRAVLVDFGLAMHWKNAPETDDALVQGTPAYMAPEQITHGGKVTPSADVYALGCAAYELLTGQLPFQTESVVLMLEQQTHAPAPAVSSVRPELVALDRVIGRALEKDPRDRYESAQAFAAAIDHALYTLTQEEEAAFETVVSPRRLQASSAAMRVLIVDDDPVFGVFASRALRAVFGSGPEALQVTVARSGAEALALEGMPPMLVLLDYHMPGMTGIEVLSVLRERQGGRELRVVVASGSAGPETMARFALLGVTEFLRKPIEFPALVQRLQVLARGNGWLRSGPEVATLSTARTKVE